MKIILSRKGFDSSSGGCPNPILPSGRLLPLPIPDAQSPIRYSDLNYNDSEEGGLNVGRIVKDLSGGRITPKAKAHLDPDLERSLCSREPGWRPLFGQSGAAQGHLMKQGVGPGDLFLFFGLFQQVAWDKSAETKGRWRFVKSSPKRHLLWGWLQVDRMEDVKLLSADALPWARLHPHFHGKREGANFLYLPREKLSLGPLSKQLNGAGCFERFKPGLSLTAPEATSPSRWLLPAWFHPGEGLEALSYHSKPWRWHKENGLVCLQSVARGQEFVLDADQYSEAKSWALSIIKEGTR